MSRRLLEDADPKLIEDPTVAAARTKLLELLPQLRNHPGCPKGTDEEILAMSYPPYYTACPNPFMGDWLKSQKVEEQERVDPGPFVADITEGKGNAFYKAHSYPTKVPHPAIMRFILHYTKPGDVVLDGFCGTGMAGVAAQACGKPDLKTKAAITAEMGAENIQWGARRAILSDLGPSATFISAGVNLPVDSNNFSTKSAKLLEFFNSNYGWMYKTKVRSGNSKATIEADIDYTVWSEIYTCPHCGGEVVFYDVAFDPDTEKVRESFNCDKCGAQLTKDSLERRKNRIKTLAGDVIERIEMRPVRIAWSHKGARGQKAIEPEDLEIIERVRNLKIAGFPNQDLPIQSMGHGSRLAPKGFTAAHHLWSDRALAALTILWVEAKKEKDLLTRISLQYWVEQSFWGLSWMNRYRPEGYSQVSQYQSGVYYVPALHAECAVRYNMVGSLPSRGKRNSLIKLWADSPMKLGQAYISTGSSPKLMIPDNSVDYVFVDPPFGQNIPYSDLALVTEQWHGVTTNSTEEATEDPFKGRRLDEYAELIFKCFKEFYRVLKPGRWMTVEFSNHSNDVWLRIQHSLASAGFVVADTRVIDKEQLSYRQVTADNAVKHDLVISAYKPAQGTEKAFEIAHGSMDGAWAFVREHLHRTHITEGDRGKALVIRERQADRVYERMVAYHVARNTLVPMTAAEFYTGLDQRFPLRDGMYFLPDQVEAYERFRISFKELASQTLFIRDESSAISWLRQQLKDKPRTFAEIQPIFMREVQAGVATWEELPDLKSMLDDNFVIDDRSRWAVPDPKKSEHLDQLRIRGLLKEFETYLPGRGPLVKFRTEAIRAGFKNAWAKKDFASIVSVGRRLPSDVFIEDSALLHYFRNAERLAG